LTYLRRKHLWGRLRNMKLEFLAVPEVPASRFAS
jgi:hypothetical protein